MILAPTLTLNAPARGYDADATAFAAASGATDVAALSAFVKGVKELGLWNSMVCWPLRSTQNAGTGTTAYSLGGLGTFNGTLVDGPLWTADGVSFDRNNDVIEITASFTAQRSAMAVGKTAVAFISPAQGMFCFEAGSTPPVSGLGYNDAGAVLSQDPNTAYNPSPSTVHENFNNLGVSSAGSGNGNAFVYRNGATVGNGASNAIATSNPRIGRFSNSGFTFGGTISIVAASTDLWTTTQHAQLHTLYKSTLGTGLGLP